jgi:RecA-family ATPase
MTRFEDLPALERARQLVRSGFSIIPIPPAEKIPEKGMEWKPYQERKPTDDELVRWFGNGRPCNMAIVTGAISGIVVIDTDGPDGDAWVQAHCPPTPWRQRSSRGTHHVYRHPGVHVRNKAKLKTSSGTVPVDVRADGGYVIAAGSVHPSGARYQLDGDWTVPLEQVPVFDPSLIAEPPPDPPALAPRRASSVNGGDVLARARAYLQRVPGAIEGQGGDTHTLSTACKIARGFSLDEETAVALLLDWNQTCTPPWTEREIRQKVANAMKYGTEPIGHLRDAERPARVAPSSPSVEGEEELRREREAIQAESEREQPRASETRFTSPLSTLLSAPDEPVPYLVERLLVLAANGFIGGEPKSLKSWLALYLALCLSLGAAVFGRYAVRQRARVLFLSEEDGERRVRRRIRQLLTGMRMDPPEDAYFRYSIKAGVLLDDPKWITRLRAELAEFQPAIVIGDVFELMHSRDGDRRAEMKPVFYNLDRLREEFQCGFLLADHFKKTTIGASRRGGQRLSGTVGKHAFGENSLYLFPAQGVNRVRVETELKDGPSEVFGLRLEDTEDGGVCFAWEAEAEDRTREMKEKILAALREIKSEDGWVTSTQAGEVAGIARGTAKKYLDLLADEDKTLERQARQRGKAKAWCYRVV